MPKTRSCSARTSASKAPSRSAARRAGRSSVVSISEENSGMAAMVSSGPHGATAGGRDGAYPSPMQAIDSTFRGAGGIELVTHRWAPDGTIAPRAAVAIVHGLGEHSGRYGAVVSALTGRGFAVHDFDLRGHGRSPGRRGHIEAWSDYRADLAAYLDPVQAQEAPGTPVFFYGHSLGGAILLEYGLRRPGGLAGVRSEER